MARKAGRRSARRRAQPLGEDEAATVIQRRYKAHAARRAGGQTTVSKTVRRGDGTTVTVTKTTRTAAGARPGRRRRAKGAKRVARPGGRKKGGLTAAQRAVARAQRKAARQAARKERIAARQAARAAAAASTTTTTVVTEEVVEEEYSSDSSSSSGSESGSDESYSGSDEEYEEEEVVAAPAGVDPALAAQQQQLAQAQAQLAAQQAAFEQQQQLAAQQMQMQQQAAALAQQKAALEQQQAMMQGQIAAQQEAAAAQAQLAEMQAEQREAAAAEEAAKAAAEAYEEGQAAAAAAYEEKEAAAEAAEAARRATIHPAEDFDPVDDANRLRKAMKGMGTDENEISRVLGQRSNAQRQEIKAAYAAEHDRDLVKDIKKECSGQYENVIVDLLRTPAMSAAHWCRKAVKGMGTNEKMLIEVLCPMNNAQLEEVKEAYASKYRDLGDTVISEVGGLTGSKVLKRIFKNLLHEGRDPEDGEVNLSKAQLDAKILHEAGEKRLGTDEKPFVDVLTRRSFKHLRTVFREYAKISNYDISKTIKREFSGDEAMALRWLIAAARDLSERFAQKLKEAMDGIGTDEWTMNRIIVSRCEIDLADISDCFTRNSGGQTLKKWINDDLDGDHQKILLYLIDGYMRT